ncbi:Kelch repeat-containing protein [Cystobacter fuscus]|uniref:Kelch repeat-containing protein n=1 Tax=Cystobacter fuscus TaxID=43 RepID=UPI0037C0ED96
MGRPLTASMGSVRTEHAATLLADGRVLVVGGTGPSGELVTAEVYDPATHTWSATGSLAVLRRHHTATLLNDGRVLVVGGTGSSGNVALAELYDPATGTWSPGGVRELVPLPRRLRIV